MDVEECRNVTKIEDTSISQFDRFLQQLFFRDHVLRHSIPCLPELVEVLKRGDRMTSVLLRESRELDRRFVDKMQSC